MKHAAWLAATLALVTSSVAHAQNDTCASAAEDGQRARLAGKLRAARNLFIKCSADACKPLIRKDCAQWASDLEGAMPSIVIDAKDGRDDVADVTVTSDGETIATKLDGKAITIDPGPHKLSFSRPGRDAIAQDVIIREGVRSRVITVRFGPEPPAGESKRQIREHTVAPWIVVAVGGAVVVTGIFLIIAAPPLPSNCSADSNACAKTVTRMPNGTLYVEPDEQLAMEQSRASSHVNLTKAGILGLLVGGSLVAGGLIWHFVEPTGPATGGAVVPWATKDGGGATAMLRF